MVTRHLRGSSDGKTCSKESDSDKAELGDLKVDFQIAVVCMKFDEQRTK
jgi:hypothetical protein